MMAVGLVALMLLPALPSSPLAEVVRSAPSSAPAGAAAPGSSALTAQAAALLHEGALRSLQARQGPSPASLTTHSSLAPSHPSLSSSGWANVTASSGATPTRSTGMNWSQQMTYDAADGYVVLFAEGSTWTYSSTGWKLDTIGTTAPPVSKGYSLAYDPLDGYVLLYGGCCGGSAASWPQSSSWRFSGGIWYNMTSAFSSPPPPRQHALLTWDGADQEMVLVGGVENFSCGAPNPCSSPLAETWSFKGGVWTNLTATAGAPPARLALGSNAVYDGRDGYVLWTGSEMQGDFETWSFKGGVWTNLTSTSGAPPARIFPALVPGPSLGEVLLFGGLTCYGAGCTPVYLGDTWRFASGSWLNLTSGLVGPPSARAGGLATFDGALGYDLLVDSTGCTSGCGALNDTWEYSFPIQATQPTATIPSGRLDLGEATTFSVAGFGGTGSYSYAWGGLPFGCTYANAPVLPVCRPTNAGTFAVNVSLTDTNGAHTNSPTLNYTVNPAPSIVSFTASPRSVDLHNTSNLTVAVAGGTTPYAFLYSGLPKGCTTQNVTTLACSSNATGEYQVYVTVTDVWGKYAQSSLFLWVNPPPLIVLPPTATPSGNVFDVGQNVRLQTVVEGGAGGNIYTWSGLPAGCTAANAPGVNCTLRSPGNYTVAVGVTDANGSVATSGPLSLEVDRALVLSSFGALPSFLSTGESTLISTEAWGGTSPLSFAYSGLPSSCASVNKATLNCTVTTPGSFMVRVNVTDAIGVSANLTTTLYVNGLAYLNVATPTLSPPVAALDSGTPTQLSTRAGGGYGGYSYSWNGLPTGCASASTATLNCTPGVPGSFSISVTVYDRTGASAISGTLALTVNPPPSVTSLTAFPVSPRVGTTTMFNATVTGGTRPYTLSWAGLPVGCASANATSIVCSPSVAGTYTVRILMVDADGRTAEANLTWVATPAPAPAKSGIAGIPLPEFVLIVALAAAVVVLLLILFLRRKSAAAQGPALEGWRETEADEEAKPAKKAAKKRSKGKAEEGKDGSEEYLEGPPEDPTPSPTPAPAKGK